MNKKILALTLSAALTLSSTPAFAQDIDCNNAEKYNSNNFMNNYSSKYNGENVKYTIKVNGKTVDLNSFNWKSLFNQKVNTTNNKVEAPVVQKPVQKPVVNKPVSKAPEATETTQTNTTVKKPEITTQAPTQTNNTAVSSYEQKVVELVNVERTKAGLPALKLDSAISNVARMKSKDMATKNYFAHQSPTYGSAGDMLTNNGIRWSAWGENIASGQRTPEAVVTAWMNSEGDRKSVV